MLERESTNAKECLDIFSQYNFVDETESSCYGNYQGLQTKSGFERACYQASDIHHFRARLKLNSPEWQKKKVFQNCIFPSI